MIRCGMYRHFESRNGQWVPCTICLSVRITQEEDCYYRVTFSSRDSFRMFHDELFSRMGTEYRLMHPEHVQLPEGM